jgi:enoyl-CoA hydratase/carnithine racemase
MLAAPRVHEHGGDPHRKDTVTASYQVQEGIAVVTMDNPPVNSLGLANRRFIADSVLRAQADAAVRAIVLTGSGRAFCGGADIREFNLPEATTAPELAEVIALVEASTTPVVAAIHGVVMGGGLELAMGCHYRIVQAGTQVALPEVRIGILPGATGTQRLPRLIGLEAALNMIVTGDTALSDLLFALPGQRLFDALVPDDVVRAAVAFAHDKAPVRPLPRSRELAVTHADAEGYLHFARHAVAASSPHYPAPLRCLDCVAQSVRLPFDAAVAYERQAVTELVWTPESAALRHAFFAERAAKKASGPGDAHIGERMLAQYRRQAAWLVQAGVAPAQIEGAMARFGFAPGAPGAPGAPLVPRTAAPAPAPASRNAQDPALSIADEEIVQRLVYAMVNEGARMLGDRTAAHAALIDFIFLSVLRFPRWRGGPMHCASQAGLYNVVAAMRRFARGDAGFWQPAPMLSKLAAEGQVFS